MSLVTADQLVAHAIGDYVLQSDWMATEKTKRGTAAVVHALFYSLTFGAMFAPSWMALLVIFGSHFVIDRWRLARYLVWAKNFVSPSRYWHSWNACRATGYPPERPDWLAVWLLIIADNVLHVLINAAALRWL